MVTLFLDPFYFTYWYKSSPMSPYRNYLPRLNPPVKGGVADAKHLGRFICIVEVGDVDNYFDHSGTNDTHIISLCQAPWQEYFSFSDWAEALFFSLYLQEIGG